MLRRAGVRLMNRPVAVGQGAVWFRLELYARLLQEALHRARRDNVEVWVASPVPRALPGGTAVGLDFLAGDCRNGVRTTITDAQVNYLAQQFDENILPTESEVFSRCTGPGRQPFRPRQRRQSGGRRCGESAR